MTGLKPNVATVEQPARAGRLASVVTGLIAGVMLAAMVPGSASYAQGNWYDGITGFGSPNFTNKPKSDQKAAKADDINDLRPGKIPWRSDEMLSQIDGAIERYRQIVSKGGWPAIPGNRMLRPGDSDERVPAVRKRLRATGDLKQGGGGWDDYDFDGTLEEAVRRFQDRHGLRTSGRVDQLTLAAMNVTADERLQQLETNRTRIVELLQIPVEDRYVLVNVPAFQLEAVERFQVEQRHRVIAGRPERETPSLKATIKALNFQPFWKVPDSVAQLDVFPRLVKEPEYLNKEGIRVLAGDFNGTEVDPRNIDWSTADSKVVKLRQDPGDKNALGLVRIDMQNEHGVYMHDTPMKPLFEQRSRAFSAGCVRVQDVFKLVSWLARYELGWENPGQVDAVVASGQALDVTLTRPVPVYFAYITAWAEQSGLVSFRNDIYNRDGRSFGPDIVDPDAPPPPQSLAP